MFLLNIVFILTSTDSVVLQMNNIQKKLQYLKYWSFFILRSYNQLMSGKIVRMCYKFQILCTIQSETQNINVTEYRNDK